MSEEIGVVRIRYWSSNGYIRLHQKHIYIETHIHIYIHNHTEQSSSWRKCDESMTVATTNKKNELEKSHGYDTYVKINETKWHDIVHYNIHYLAIECPLAKNNNLYFIALYSNKCGL